MKKELRIVDDKRGIVQVTTSDERWYSEIVTNPVTGLPEVTWKPSVTFITGSYPKGVAYMQWLAKNGWDESEKIKIEAGDRGTIVHHAIEQLIMEGQLAMNALVKDREGVEREMTADEYFCVKTFSEWYESVGRPKVAQVERTVVSQLHGYAGTLDYLFEMNDGTKLLIDVKTSKYIWPSHELQVTALMQACKEEGIFVDKIGIVQVGYTLNKKAQYKFTEVTPNLDLFLSVKNIWANEHNGETPLQRDLPLEIVLTKNT